MAEERLRVLWGLSGKKGENFFSEIFKTEKEREKEGKVQINSLYRVKHERTPAVQLNSSAIDGLDHPRVSTTKIRSPFEI